MCYNGRSNNKRQRRESERNFKVVLSSDRSLKLGCVKLESLVIVDHHATVNLCTSLVHTARQAMVMDFGGSFLAGLEVKEISKVTLWNS